jgi:hypothetical protein
MEVLLVLLATGAAAGGLAGLQKLVDYTVRASAGADAGERYRRAVRGS